MIVPFERNKIIEAIFSAAKREHGNDKKLAEKLALEVLDTLNQSYQDSIPNVEDIQDVAEHILKKNGHIRTAESFIVYRAGRTGVRNGLIPKNCFLPDGIPRQKIEKIKDWNEKHKCSTTKELNDWVKNKNIKQLVDASIAEYEKDLLNAANIISKKENIKLVIMAGPSSSGKTTTVCKLGEHLKKVGKKFKIINVDNYFQGWEAYEKDKTGDMDYEKPEALRIDLINQHLSELVKGNKIMMPFYDFKTGNCYDNRIEFGVEDDEIILLDSLHGLYPKMTASVPENMKCKLMIGTFNVIRDSNDIDKNKYTRWTDIRLLRRMLRDRDHRNHEIKDTLTHWHYVRNSELKHIIPYIQTAEYIINGGLAFELPVLKKHIGNDFPDPEQFKGDDFRIDAYVRAKRVKKLLDSIEAIDDSSIVPKDSHLREFIGGSVYDVH